MLGIKSGPGLEVVLKELNDSNTSIKSIEQEWSEALIISFEVLSCSAFKCILFGKKLFLRLLLIYLQN